MFRIWLSMSYSSNMAIEYIYLVDLHPPARERVKESESVCMFVYACIFVIACVGGSVNLVLPVCAMHAAHLWVLYKPSLSGLVLTPPPLPLLLRAHERGCVYR